MARKTTNPNAEPASPPSERAANPAARPEVNEIGHSGTPREHYRGEPSAGPHTGDPGDVELETLDADAPYNKSYGH